MGRVCGASLINRLYGRGHRSEGFHMTRIERAARALCRFHNLPENTKFEGRPMWESYVPEVEAILSALNEADRPPNDRP